MDFISAVLSNAPTGVAMKRPKLHFLLSRFGPKSVALTVLAVLLAIFWYIAMRGLRGGREETLVECTNTLTTIHFKTELGQYFQLTFTNDPNSQSKYTGHVHLINEVTKQTADFNTDSNYFFQISTNPILQPDSQYEMTVSFPPKTKPATEITLQWIQRAGDRGK
jgi:hypothetical protein